MRSQPKTLNFNKLRLLLPLKNKLMQRRKTLNKQQLKRRPRQPEKQQWLPTMPLKPQEPPLRSIMLLSRLLLMKLPKLLLRKLLQRLKDRSQPPKEQLKTKRQRKHLKNSLPRRLLLPRQLKLQQPQPSKLRLMPKMQQKPPQNRLKLISKLPQKPIDYKRLQLIKQLMILKQPTKPPNLQLMKQLKTQLFSKEKRLKLQCLLPRMSMLRLKHKKPQLQTLKHYQRQEKQLQKKQLKQLLPLNRKHKLKKLLMKPQLLKQNASLRQTLLQLKLLKLLIEPNLLNKRQLKKLLSKQQKQPTRLNWLLPKPLIRKPTKTPSLPELLKMPDKPLI